MMAYGLDILTPPDAPVMNLNEVRHHLGLVGEHADDHLLEQIVAAATEYVQEQTGQQLVQAEYRLTLDRFPADGEAIRLPLPPLVGITHMQYHAPDGLEHFYTTQTAGEPTFSVGGKGFIYDTARKPGRLVPGDGHWPATASRPDAVQIKYLAGHAEPADVPKLLRQAVLLLVGHWYENREATTPLNLRSVPLAVENILATHHYPEVV